MTSGTAMTEQKGASAIEVKESATAEHDAAALAEAERRVQIETRLRMQAVARTAQARRDAASARLEAEQASKRVREMESALRHGRATLAPLKNAILPFLRTAGRALPQPIRRFTRRASTVLSWTMHGTLLVNLRARSRSKVVALAAAPVVRPGAEAQAPAWGTQQKLRIMFISGEAATPGHLYRVERAAAAAALAGAETTWIPAEDIAARSGDIAESGLVWIWRVPWSDALGDAIMAARRNGARIIYDVDDLMVDPKLARLDIIDGIRSQYLTEAQVTDHYSHIRDAMSLADFCVTTTDELAGHIRAARMPTYVLPNGFDRATWDESRLAARRRAATPDDGLVRIGYAGGSRTHQRDFALCTEAMAAIMRTHPEVRLVVFRTPDHTTSLLDLEEFPALAGLEDRLEWRDLVPLPELPHEVARFDINLAPLEVGNVFCEAKSELKVFEAALAGVPTIASPTGPFRRAIRHGETGFLADGQSEWHAALERLVGDPALRREMARTARRDALWAWGPERRLEMVRTILELAEGGSAAARAFELEIRRGQGLDAPLAIVPHEVIFEADRCDAAQVTVVLPLYNYSAHVLEALESAKAQSLPVLDLVLIDDGSTDDGLEKALAWIRANAPRFNRAVVARNLANSGLAATRNVGFDLAETAYVLPLDADNLLEPACAAACLHALGSSGAAFAYPVIQRFGEDKELMGTRGYDPLRLANANYIDAMALVSRAAWAHVGGYEHIKGGWEDFEFWCRIAEHGLRGVQVPGTPLARYRVHGSSMMRSAIADPRRIRDMMTDLTDRHPWLTLVWELPPDAGPAE